MIVELPEPNPPGFSELLNQIYLPTGIDDELKSDTREEPLMAQFTIPGRFTVTTTICVFVQHWPLMYIRMSHSPENQSCP